LAPGFLGRKIRLELFLDPHQVVGERKPECLELVQLLKDAEVKLVRILGRGVHLVDEESELCLKVFECHALVASLSHLVGASIRA
jgi:hypothetical protein